MFADDAADIRAGREMGWQIEAALRAITAALLRSTQDQERVRELEAALRDVLSIPALNQILGTNHSAGCDCPLCRARAALPAPPQPEESE